MSLHGGRVVVLPGPGLVARWPGVLLVILDDAESAGARRLHAELDAAVAGGSDDRGIAFRLAGVLAAAGPGRLPAFGVVMDGQDGLAVLLHGALSMRAARPDGDTELRGDERPTWVDAYVEPEATRLELVAPDASLPPAIPTMFDLRDGVVSGGGAIVFLEAEPAAAAPGDASAGGADDELPSADAPSAGEPPAEFEVIDISAPQAVREPLPIATGPAPTAEADAGGEPDVVEGILCSRGHFNHPQARYCAHCGIAMVHLTHQLVRQPRPPLGILVFADGRTLGLDASYVIGRDPGGDDAVAAGEARPFVLEDPDRVLSRVHAAVMLTGWDVNLIDRHSANGTYLRTSDEGEWERLLPGEAHRLDPGSRVRVGEHTFVFESHHQVA